MVGLFYILLFWLIGNALSLVTGGYVSGNIIGMILLFAALCMRWVRAETVRPAARFLLGAMALFFVPYAIFTKAGPNSSRTSGTRLPTTDSPPCSSPPRK